MFHCLTPSFIDIGNEIRNLPKKTKIMIIELFTTIDIKNLEFLGSNNIL
jgi:hypothetical protein